LLATTQAGFCAAVLIASGLAAVTRRRHLPRDLAAGGTLAYILARLAKLGSRDSVPLWYARGWCSVGRPSPVAVEQTLHDARLEVIEVQGAEVDARGSAPLVGKTIRGPGVFVKTIGRDQRTADWLFKAARFLAFREVEDEAPFATPK
jgi:hypothetical protein